MKNFATLTCICLFQFLIRKALSCKCVEFHDVPHSLPKDTLCSNGNTYNGRDYYYTNNNLAYLFYNNLNGTWQVGASLGTSSYYLISYNNVSLPQHTISWDIKSPTSSSFSTSAAIYVTCKQDEESSSGYKTWYLIPIFVPVAVIFCVIRYKGRQGTLCKKQSNQNNRSRRACRLCPCCGQQDVGVAARTSTSGTTQRSNGTQQGQRIYLRTRPNERAGQEGRETGRRGSISDMPGYSSILRDNGASGAPGGVRHIQVSDGRELTGPPPYPADRGLSPPPSYSSISTSLPGGDNVPPPPTYEVATMSPQYK